jgi:hypothetical protein
LRKILKAIKHGVRFISYLPFAAVLPAMWGVTCFVEFFFPGDEYFYWAAASLPGLWIILLKGNAGDIHSVLLPVVLGGAAVMSAVGFAMDRLRLSKAIWPWLYVSIAIGLLVATIASYPSWHKAMSKNGSLAAYALFASNAGVYLAAIVSLGVAGVLKIRSTVRGK